MQSCGWATADEGGTDEANEGKRYEGDAKVETEGIRARTPAERGYFV